MLPLLVLLILLSQCACERAPESYPPPEQRHPVEVEANVPIRASMMVNMNDLDAKQHFVKDISDKLEGATWRWTQKRPTVKVLLVKTQNLRFTADFTIWEGCIAQTGPVNISFYVGDKLLDKVRYDTAGYKHFIKLVESSWLQTSAETVISMEIDKLYVAPEDKTTLGFILTRMGFERP